MPILSDRATRRAILKSTGWLPYSLRVKTRYRLLGDLEVAKARRGGSIIIGHPKSGNTWLRTMIARAGSVARRSLAMSQPTLLAPCPMRAKDTGAIARIMQSLLTVRRGKVGGYREDFTPEQVLEIDALVASRLSPSLGYGPSEASDTAGESDTGVLHAVS